MCLFSLVVLINVVSAGSVSADSSQDVFIRSQLPDLTCSKSTIKPVKPLIHQSDNGLSNSLHFTLKAVGWHSYLHLEWVGVSSSLLGRTHKDDCKYADQTDNLLVASLSPPDHCQSRWLQPSNIVTKCLVVSVCRGLGKVRPSPTSTPDQREEVKEK